MARSSSARKKVEQAFQETIRQVVRCIASDGLFSVSQKGSERRSLGFRHTDRSRLRVRRAGSIYLNVEHAYDVVEDPERGVRVRTASYIYTVFDETEQRVLGYHYHPEGRGGETAVVVPHLHIYRDGDVCGRQLSKVHLRTGRVAIEDVIELLVEDLGVVVRHPYDVLHEGEGVEEWQRVLRVARAEFARLRSWSSWGPEQA